MLFIENMKRFIMSGGWEVDRPSIAILDSFRDCVFCSERDTLRSNVSPVAVVVLFRLFDTAPPRGWAGGSPSPFLFVFVFFFFLFFIISLFNAGPR